jgi:2-polyprenyl-6-methoxyphenol hydroxylase-like FAD-dependent oxidoreductase
MQVAVIGAGPVGLFAAIALARRGHRVTVVDRDSGPPAAGHWQRRGVMQFDHAHTFRAPVVATLQHTVPDALAALEAAGATVAAGADRRPVALLCRRSTFERVLRRVAGRQPGVTVRTGHVDRIERRWGRAAGVSVDGGLLTADVVLDASGRASRCTAGLRPPAQGGDCGAVYVTRQYRLRDGAPHGPVNSPIGLSLSFPGHLAIAFLHDDRTFSISLNHAGVDRRLRLLRHDAVFDAAVRAIPELTEWIDPPRAHPISSALPGGRLYNTYRGQLDATGAPVLPGMISVGDAVCTTTPLAGRGVTLGLLQAQRMIELIDDLRDDIVTATMQFDQWCESEIKPWYDDHRYTDDDRLRRWAGGDIDLSRRLPSDLIVAAAGTDPQLQAAVAPYAAMAALPVTLTPVEPRAREIYATGWRPEVPAGPTHQELAELCERAAVNVATTRTPTAV